MSVLLLEKPVGKAGLRSGSGSARGDDAALAEGSAAPDPALTLAGTALDPTDVDLEQRWRAGSEEAYAELFRRHYPRAVAFVQRILVDRSTAEDVAQAALLRIYETSRGKAGRFDGLVLTTARNLALNEIRRRGRKHAARPGLEGVDAPTGAETPADAGARTEEETRIASALAALEGEERDAFALRREGKDYNEIGSLMNLHPDAVRRRVARALEAVRSALLGPSGSEVGRPGPSGARSAVPSPNTRRSA